MSKFWQKKYISKYTGEEIDAAVDKAAAAPEIEANADDLGENPVSLASLKIGDHGYEVSRTSFVVVYVAGTAVNTLDNSKTMTFSWSVKVAVKDGQTLSNDELFTLFTYSGSYWNVDVPLVGVGSMGMGTDSTDKLQLIVACQASGSSENYVLIIYTIGVGGVDFWQINNADLTIVQTPFTF